MNMIWIGFSCAVAVVRSVSVSVLSNRKQPPKWLCGLEKKYQPQPQSLVGSFPAWLRQWLVPSFLTPCWFMSSSTLRSPMSCLPLLFDQRDGLGAGVRVRPENVPPASSHIELLLEKHGSGEMGVNSEWDWKKRYTPVVPRGFQSTTWLKRTENIVNIHFFHFLRPLNETVWEVEVTGWTAITLTEGSGVVFILRTHKLSMQSPVIKKLICNVHMTVFTCALWDNDLVLFRDDEWTWECRDKKEHSERIRHKNMKSSPISSVSNAPLHLISVGFPPEPLCRLPLTLTNFFSVVITSSYVGPLLLFLFFTQCCFFPFCLMRLSVFLFSVPSRPFSVFVPLLPLP